jgi:hypothetical protein
MREFDLNIGFIKINKFNKTLKWVEILPKFRIKF